MVMMCETDEQAKARMEKVMTLKKNIKNQQVLDQVLASFPERLRQEALDKLRPHLKFTPKEL